MRKFTDPSLLTDCPRPVAGLSEAEQHALRRWVIAARDAGIDCVQDLASRHWSVPINGALLGVFTRGDHYAAWLAVGQNGMWAVASCIDGSVSPPLDSLEEALAIVYRACAASECA